MKPIFVAKAGDASREIAETHGDFHDWVQRRMFSPGCDVSVANVHRGGTLPCPSELSGAVITGSRAMVTDREPWSENLSDWAARLVQQEVPVLGICFGHQVLAHGLGGQVIDHPRGREVGTVEITSYPEAAVDLLFKRLPGVFRAHVTHDQTVVDLPAGAVVLAGNAHEPHHAVRFGPWAWGVQFHPEFDEGIMHAYIRRHAETLMRKGFDPESLARKVTGTPDVDGLLRQFVALAQRRASSSDEGAMAAVEIGN
ncbi:MAG: glutamine amidotransferase [Gammaproteobacteria bacterium]|nr:MAG: glutamine amidotransferase [Gammaproteobacteria bacterium]